MGTVTVTRSINACSEAELRTWYLDQLEEMAREGGTDAYCGNWNSNGGLRVHPLGMKTRELAEKHANDNFNKRGPVVAYRVGTFNALFPASKADQALVAKSDELESKVAEFDWHILERARNGKSRIRKCEHCESGINVHKLERLTLKDYLEVNTTYYSIPNAFYRFGKRLFTFLREVTDCPVCSKNLLKTATDLKTLVSLQVRSKEASGKTRAAREAYKVKMSGTNAGAHWFITADCGD
jgi:hypothetical protein